MDNIYFLELQLALFFSKSLTERPDQLSVTVNEQLNNTFDGLPIILPLAPATPPGVDFPFLLLKSTDGAFRCDVSQSRANFFYGIEIKDTPEDIKQIQDQLKDKFIKYFEIFEQMTGVKRIGYSTRNFVKTADSKEYIYSKFIKKNIPDLFDVSLRFNQKSITTNFELNDITQINAGELTVKDQTEAEAGILIQKDINTVNEIEYKFDSALFQDFIQEAQKSLTTESINKLLE